MVETSPDARVVGSRRASQTSVPQLGLEDEAIANVLTYVYNQWDNNGTEVTPEMVKSVRDAGVPVNGSVGDGRH